MKKLQLAFRVDASTQIGSGHWMRCMILAKKIQKVSSAEIHFISRCLPGNLLALVEKNIYLHVLPLHKSNTTLNGYASWLTVSQSVDANETVKVIKDIGRLDYLIVDHYAIDVVWEKILRHWTDKIIVIDDLANRFHDCDVILDQNFDASKAKRFRGIVPSHCKLLLGARYLLLREEFYVERLRLPPRNGIVNNILIFYGSSDSTNETLKAIIALSSSEFSNMNITVLVGSSNINKQIIQKKCQQHGYRYICQKKNIASLMREADLSFGSAGMTTWERCFLGLPTIVTATAKNQSMFCLEYHSARYIYYIGSYEYVDADKLRNALRLLVENHDLYTQLSRAGMELNIGEYYKNWSGLGEF